MITSNSGNDTAPIAATNATAHRESESSIGDLLIAAGLITPTALANATKSLAQRPMPVGKMLIEAGIVTSKDLDTASKLDMIRRSTSLSLAIAAQTFRYVVNDNMTLPQALSKAGIEGQVISYSRIGLLLVDAKLISKTQFEQALQSAKGAGIPIGKMLCLMGLLDADLVEYVLCLQQELRTRATTKDEAIRKLRIHIASRSNSNVQIDAGEDADSEQPERHIKLIELLIMSNVITETDLLKSVERAIEQNSEAAKLLVDGHLLKEPVLETALSLLQEVNKGNIPVTAAKEVLSYISNIETSGPDNTSQASA